MLQVGLLWVVRSCHLSSDQTFAAIAFEVMGEVEVMVMGEGEVMGDGGGDGDGEVDGDG